MCSSIPPAAYMCSAGGCHRQMLLGMLGLGWFQPSQQDIQNSTHIFTPDVLGGGGVVFCGWGRVDGEERFPLLTKVICLEQMWLRITKRKKKKTDSVRAHLLMLLSLFGFILHLIGKTKELNASEFEFKI